MAATDEASTSFSEKAAGFCSIKRPENGCPLHPGRLTWKVQNLEGDFPFQFDDFLGSSRLL